MPYPFGPMFRFIIKLPASLAVIFLLLAPAGAPAAEKTGVTVFAAESLREAFEAAAPAFTRATGYPVRFDFAGSEALAAQLAQGVPADVYASANAQQMQKVAAFVGAPRTFAHTRLVAIAPKDDAAVATIADLGKPGLKLVLVDASVPVGAYARAAFTTLAKDPAYGDDFVTRVNANVVSDETDVKAVVAKIALGEDDAGVVFTTDVTPALAPKLRVLRFPPGAAPEATYAIATVKASQNADGANAFVAFITSAEGKAYLKERGFEE